MSSSVRQVPRPSPVTVSAIAVVVGCALPAVVLALGEETRFDVRRVEYSGSDQARPSAPRRLAWEVRKRTSIETRLTPTSVRLDDPTVFQTPFLYWSGDSAFPPLTVDEVAGLRRFVEFGGFVLIDDAAPRNSGFDRSVRRELRRAFPSESLETIDSSHTVFRSFYLLNRPVGRVRGPATLLGIRRGERLAVAYSRHDLGGAWARDNLGSWEHDVSPGGDRQRELAIRLGVNLVMYSLCLDYKDDQVHAPFIMRRRGGGGSSP